MFPIIFEVVELNNSGKHFAETIETSVTLVSKNYVCTFSERAKSEYYLFTDSILSMN